ncbi:MAG: Rieske 2Fe-2S domain-containing protein [Acidobacteriaceae bacterium]|nr:Rieske 2Fe-2S domain-containing protein [Acidobacteriaceae bacterium]
MTATDLEMTLGPLSQIPPGEGRNFEVAGERVAVFHTRSGGVFAVQANCPHKNGPLADGLVGGTTVICPLHAWKFDVSTGEPTSFTASQAGGGSCKLKTYAVRVDENQRIVLTLQVPEMVEAVM